MGSEHHLIVIFSTIYNFDCINIELYQKKMETLQFYSQSKITNTPEEMGGVRNWRKRLSNFWPVIIVPKVLEVKGVKLFNEEKVFYSIEQAFHYAKFHFTTQKMSDDYILNETDILTSITIESSKAAAFGHFVSTLAKKLKLEPLNKLTTISRELWDVERGEVAEIERLERLCDKEFEGKGLKICNAIKKQKEKDEEDYTFANIVRPFMVEVKKSSGKRNLALDVDTWKLACVPVMEHLLATRAESDKDFKKILIASQGKNLLHFERTGIRSFWGGSIGKTDGRENGTNKLGHLMMELRDETLIPGETFSQATKKQKVARYIQYVTTKNSRPNFL